MNLTNIEVCEEDGWREICDSALSDEDAQVICRELGYLDIGAFITTTIVVIKHSNCTTSNNPRLLQVLGMKGLINFSVAFPQPVSQYAMAMSQNYQSVPWKVAVEETQTALLIRYL